MPRHQPDIVLHQRPDGRWVCRCLTCDQAFKPTLHKPAAEDWKRAHIKEALG